MTGTSRHARSRCRSAFTLVEMVISLLLVSIMLVAALRTVGASALGQRVAYDQRRGYQLAQDLMNEIIPLAYADPKSLEALITEFYATGSATPTLGPELPESADDWTGFDDVDDFHDWSSSPPMMSDGTTMDDLPGWRRSVTIDWVLPGDVGTVSAEEMGVRRITVKVTHDGRAVAELAALRVIDGPAVEACCLIDDSCLEVPSDTCGSMGGKPMGALSECMMVDCTENVVVLFVSGGSYVWAGTGEPIVVPTADEQDRIALIESWSYRVALVSHSAPLADFDEAVDQANVVYVSAEISDSALLDKLTGRGIGIVSEAPGLVSEFGLAWIAGWSANSDTFTKVNPTHEITTPLAGAPVTFSSSAVALAVPIAPVSPELDFLGMVDEVPAFAALEQSALRFDATPAPARRVHVPFANLDVATLSADGQTLIQRAIAWAAASGGPAGGAAECSMGVSAISMGYRKQGQRYYGQATIEILEADFSPIEGATVTIEWSGDVTGTSQGVTNAVGVVMLESADVHGGGTYTCTVVDVVVDSCAYDPVLDVITSSTIIAP